MNNQWNSRSTLSSDMVRSATSNPGRSTQSIVLTGNSKRPYPTMLSNSYTYGSVYHQPAQTSAPHQLNGVKEFDIASWLEQRPSNDEYSPYAATKRQRVDSFGASQPSFHSYSQHSFVPSVPSITPGTSMSSSNHLSPSSFGASEAMSRQSSTMSGSFTQGFDMLRFDSQSSSGDMPFAFDEDLNSSVMSCNTQRPPKSAPTSAGLLSGNNDLLFGNMGFVGQSHFPSSETFSFYSQDSSGITEAGYPQQPGFQSFTQEGFDKSNFTLPSQPLELGHTSQDMSRTTSTQSSSSSSSSVASTKTSTRRLKQIENSKQPIIPRRHVIPINSGPTSSPPSTNNSKPSTNTSTTKLALPKQPYQRPSHPKLLCPHCNAYPKGFRGDHELNRHLERAHARKRKVWICVEPSQNPDHKPPTTTKPANTAATPQPCQPLKPLSICKQCKQGKQYNVYYNAAAHLRRAHFCPRKRGRKAKGEIREIRAGKAGGDWPAIEALKLGGWLREVVVEADRGVEVEGEGEEGVEGEGNGGVEEMFAAFQGAAERPDSLPQHHGYQHTPLPPSLPDWNFQPTDTYSAMFAPACQGQQQFKAPAMLHTMSAPGAFGTYDAVTDEAELAFLDGYGGLGLQGAF